MSVHVLHETMEMAEVFAGIAEGGTTPVDMRRVAWRLCAGLIPYGEWPYRCTRQHGHDGQHVASAFETVARTWPA